MSAGKDQEYFADGLSEEVLNLLAKIPDLRVAARTSAFKFKGEKLDVQDVAQKLNVAHILEGSVRKSGNKVRITAQLIKPRTVTTSGRRPTTARSTTSSSCRTTLQARWSRR
jgi:TolB-like protein